VNVLHHIMRSKTGPSVYESADASVSCIQLSGIKSCAVVLADAADKQ